MLLGLLVLVCVVTGCTQYYRVTEPKSGKVYYTNSWMAGRWTGSGSAHFIDIGSGKEVTLQDTEVEKVSKEEAERFQYSGYRSP